MRKSLQIVVFGLGLAIAPGFAMGQAKPAADTAAKAAPTIPVEDQATPEQVDRLFQVMRVRQQMDLAIKQMSTMMQRQVAESLKNNESALPDSSKRTPAQTEALEQLRSKIMDQAIHMYTVDEMLADIKPIYERHISKQDVEAFIAFFGSSSGQHFLDEQPLIAKEYLPVVMERVQAKTKELTEQVKKQIDELKAKEDAGSAAPTKP